MSKQTLPIDSFLPDIVAGVTQGSAVILMAEPGAGKTTRVPPALIRAGGGRWIVLQPRRWAARLTAERIAQELGCRVGEQVGYQVRFENRTSPSTQIILMTEGILLRRLVDDPELSGVSGVVLDEFHERSLDLDLTLALLKEIQGSIRPDLKLVVMSATLDAAPLEKYLPGAVTLNIPGRTFPVEKRYSSGTGLYQAWKSAEPGEGDTLVFLPGSREIERSIEELSRGLAQDRIRGIDILPLYASLPEERQKAVFREGGGRKIICATNIAETSITLPGITLVIDSGWQKVMRMDPVFGMGRLETLRISRASAEQRAGRAGRVKEGICVRMWSEGEHTQLRHFETPEIHRVNLGRALLTLSEFGVRDFRSFDWFEAPRSSMLDYAIRELESLGFLENGAIMEKGRRALRLPLEPRLAALAIVSGQKGVPEFGARLGAWLEQLGPEESIRDEDALIRRLNRLSPVETRSARQIFGRDSIPELEPKLWEKYLEVMLDADHSRVCVGDKIVGRRKVRSRDGVFPAASILLSSRDQGEILAQSWVPVPIRMLEIRAERKRRVIWDDAHERMRAQEGLYFEDLEVGPVRDAPVGQEEAAAGLASWILADPVGILSRNELFRKWWSRVAFTASHLPGSETAFEPDWEMILQGLCAGNTRLASILEGDLPGRIEPFLDRSFRTMLERFAPERLEVPTGGRIAIDYSQDPPRLAVRLQEVFGWLETPRVAEGRVPVLLELLSPGFKPIQLTRDLRSFWANAYFEVKKELKARYPKHSWPEDPLTAKPEAKGRRRG